MRREWRVTASLAVAVIAYLAAAFLQAPSAITALIAVVGLGGLVGALWELAKANLEHQHRLDEQDAGNAFVVSATSHMAEVAFDKHVEFCEKYVTKVREAVSTLLRKGPTDQMLNYASELNGIRAQYILWETPEVGRFLEGFEKALTEIGAHKIQLEELEVGNARTEVVREMYKTLALIIKTEMPDDISNEVAAAFVVEGLRDHLGIVELTVLRKRTIEAATKRLK